MSPASMFPSLGPVLAIFALALTNLLCLPLVCLPIGCWRSGLMVLRCY
ncbi:hypothetical protein NWF32_22125 [Pseudomonas qingdaonensis]|nr:hypothetical protein [Pseudomonas qingdaonensis]